MKLFLILFSIILWTQASAQVPAQVQVFKDFPMNFKGEKRDTADVLIFQGGRLVFKKVKAPIFKNGTDVKVKMTLKSAGDPWDKVGSLFVITDPDKVSLLDIAQEMDTFPAGSTILEKYPGIKRSENYTPVLEILRFMTPFGVGYYSDEKQHPRVGYLRPVYVPKWAEEVAWERDLSDIATKLTGEFYIGLWLDTWTDEGYVVDVKLEYSGRPKSKKEVIPLVNTLYYTDKEYPGLFATSDLNLEFKIPEEAENIKLYYIVTGHGGHEGGDEFTRKRNILKIDGKVILDTIPWRDDCAAFRRFNPSSGVWLKEDSSYAYNEDGKRVFQVIKERIASSDLSRSNWCPGSIVEPYIVKLGRLKKGKHRLSIHIPATPYTEKKMNFWLVSAYLTYETEARVPVTGDK